MPTIAMANKNKKLAVAPAGEKGGGHDESTDKFGFRSSLWTLEIIPAGSPDEKVRLEALDRLLTRYQSPLKAYLRAALYGVSADWIDDCFQSFVEKKIMKRKLIETADRQKGRFRDLLKTSIRNFAMDELGPGGRPPPEPLDSEVEGDAVADDSSEGDMRWAHKVLKDALGQLKAEFLKKQQMVHLVVFARRRLPVLLGDPEIESLQETISHLKHKLNVELSQNDVSARQKTAEKGFFNCVCDILGEYCASDEDIQEELKWVCDLLIAANRLACFGELRETIKREFEASIP